MPVLSYQRPMLWLSLFILPLSALACTEPMSPEQLAAQRASQGLKDAHQNNAGLTPSMIHHLKAPNNLFQRLAQQPAALDQWEQSDAWVAFFQGQLSAAIKAFEESAQKGADELSALGLARAHLELAESYATLAQATQKMTAEWLEIERQSPHAQAYQRWYDWVELAQLNAPQASRTVHSSPEARREALTSSLKESPQHASWLKVALSLSAEEPPSEASDGYKLWLRFAHKVGEAREAQTEAQKSALASARKLQARLLKRGARALTTPILKVQPPASPSQAPTSKEASETSAVPELRLFDPRLAAVHRDYHALEALEALKSVTSPWSALLIARAHLALARPDLAQSALEPLTSQALSALPSPSESFLLLSPHLTTDDALLEAHASLKVARCALQQPSSTSSTSSKAMAPTSSPSSDDERTTTLVWRLWSEARCAALSARPSALSQIELNLTQLRRPLIQAVYEHTQGPAAARLASLALAERWLDALSLRAAEALISADERVHALKLLSTTEDTSASMRLGGRNRLDRLSMSATHQLNLKRYRVASKYFLRLREHLPAVSSLAEMTSDVLSGTSFSATKQVNAGQ